MPSRLSEFNRMFFVALSVLFQLCLFHFKLMLIHDGAVLAPALLASILQHDVFLCYNIYVLLFIFSLNALVLLLCAICSYVLHILS